LSSVGEQAERSHGSSGTNEANQLHVARLLEKVARFLEMSSTDDHTEAELQAAMRWAAHLPPGTDPRSVDLLAEGSLARAWAHRCAEAPERPALLGADGLTYGELETRSRSVAGRFARAGLRPGDRVLMSAAASSDLVVAYVAAQRLGLVVVPVNGAYTRREIAYILGDARPSGAIVDDPERAGWMREAGVVAGPEVELPDGPEPELDAAPGDDLALIAYTSGTTGAPKGAMLSSANLLASAMAVRIAWRWTAHDRLILALPLFHIHGLGVGLHGTLVAGASAALLPRFDVDAVLDAAARYDATLFFGVPTMYARLAVSPRAGELGRLRLCVSGSAPLPADLHRALEKRAGQRVLERYGMTETAMNVSNPYDGERRAGSVGLPLPGVELRIAADGEIELRGPNVFRGYWEREQATAESFTQDGWFRTGDLGTLDADGYLRIQGRSKELIITGGYNVYPREVEDVLREHPGVADAAVAGLPDAEWGEIVAAWVVSAGEGLDLEALRAFAAEQLAGYKRPRTIRIVPELPRNALGKVLKHELPALS
jgi:malonyl-CoA/methylmalonyl-CoA synthetase